MKRVVLLDRFKQRLDPEHFSEFADVEVVTVYSNEEALTVHRRNRADLIITELYGSGMSTVRFCEQLREEAGLRGVSVIVYCRDNDVERAEAARCRANAALTLPVSRRGLHAALDRLLNVPPRFPFRGAFSARTTDRSSPPVECRSEDISVTGMLIEAKRELRKGDSLSFLLPLTAARTYPALAEVVRSAQDRPAGGWWYGIRFSRLETAARQAIGRLGGGRPKPEQVA